MSQPNPSAKLKLLIAKAHKRIEAALPEDEPDLVPDWVCELLIKLGLESAAETRAQAIRETAERCVGICKRNHAFDSAGDIFREFLSKEDGK